MKDNSGAHGPERLRVYHRAVELGGMVDDMLAKARCSASLADEVRRTADSLVLNIGEGGAHFSPGRKIYHYQTALGSAGELIAALTRLRHRNPHLDLERIHNAAKHISAMLTALIHAQEKRRESNRRSG